LPIVGALLLGIIYSTIQQLPGCWCNNNYVAPSQIANDQNVACGSSWLVGGRPAGGIIIIIIAILYAATNNKKEILLKLNKQATLRTTILNRQSNNDPPSTRQEDCLYCFLFTAIFSHTY
jgi:hypothetical protein